MPLSLELVFAFSVLGLVDTTYLSYHAIKKTPVACWFFPPEWCHKVQFSPQSKLILGIPNAYLGLAMYVAILVLAYLFYIGSAPFWPVIAVVLFGFAFSMYFTYVQAFVLKAFCTWCVVSAVNFTVMTIAVLFLR